MYGRKKYRSLSKSIEAVSQVDNSVPTFICSKCKQIRQSPPGHIDVLITVANKTNLGYKVCWGCSVLLETWMKG
jgi:hypothetical protein